ncbi:MAG: hypothetical protein ACLP50_08135 [Solirubrobacteraceae bacterium]
MSPRIGVWRAIGRLGNYTVRELMWPEVTCAIVLGIGGGVAIVNTTKLADRVSAMGQVLALAAALLVVVFAGLALVVSIPSQDYMRRLAETPDGGMLRFLDPFLVAVGTETALVLLALVYSLVASQAPTLVEHVAFYAIAFLLVFGLLDVVALARSLVRHGLNRGVEAADSPPAAAGAEDVPRIDQRRRGD